jgi:DNA-binding NarL/FixJ family response regulator
MPSLRLFLLDDHQMFRDGLRLILERVPGLTVVGEAGDGPTALALLRDRRPDVVVTDIHLPGEDGITVAARIKAQLPAVRIIFLSSDADLALVQRALDGGCSGYVLKENAHLELIRALETAGKGGIYLCPDIATAVLQGYRQQKPAPAAPEAAALSARELAVLHFIADGLRNKEIADRLEISVKSVETYRSRLLRKRGCDSTAMLVRHAIREGLIQA